MDEAAGQHQHEQELLGSVQEHSQVSRDQGARGQDAPVWTSAPRLEPHLGVPQTQQWVS